MMHSHRRAATRIAVLVGLVATAMSSAFVAAAPPVAACSCAGATDQEALAGADVAFVGTLVDVVTPDTSGRFTSADPERFDFDVIEVFKGEAAAVQSVVTPLAGANCGLEIEGTGPFLVFAYEESTLVSDGPDGALYSHLCSGTRPLPSGDAPPGFEGRPPTAGDRPGSESAGGSAGETRGADDAGNARRVAVVAGAVVVLGAAAVGWRTIQRRRAT